MTERTLIPQKLYIGYNIRNYVGSFPQVYMTPSGTDSISLGRMKAVDRYSTITQIVDNVPQQGFIISHVTGKGESWIISDPRGFSIAIDGFSVSQLLRDITVVKGQIIDTCIWARCAKNNVLLNVNSDTYAKSVIQTQISNSKESWKKIQIGNHVTLTNGAQGIYLGKYYKICLNRWTSPFLSVPYDINYHVLLEEHNHSKNRTSINKGLIFSANMKLARKDSSNQLDDAQAEHMVNQLLADPTCESDQYIFMVQTKPWDTFPNLLLEDYKHNDITQLPLDKGHKVLVELNGNKAGFFRYLSYRNNQDVSLDMIDWEKLQNEKIISNYSRNLGYVPATISDVKKLYLVKAVHTTSHGNCISRYI